MSAETKKKRRINERRAEAIQRQKESDILTFQQKLIKLDLRLGKDIGATRERKKIIRQIEWEKNHIKIPSATSEDTHTPNTVKKKKNYQKPKRS